MGARGGGKLTRKDEVRSPAVHLVPEVADQPMKTFLVALAFTFEKQDK